MVASSTQGSWSVATAALASLLVIGCAPGSKVEREPPALAEGTHDAPAEVPAPGVSTSASPPTTPACQEAAGRLTLYLIPPGVPLDWSTPNRLLASAAKSLAAGKALVRDGRTGSAHEIGHLNVEMECGDASIALTGQTGGGSEWKLGGDGLGVLLRDFPGEMDGSPDNADKTQKDIELRQKSGLVTRMTFAINRPMCERIKAFQDEYVRRKAYSHYGSLYRARRFEGAGCAIYGAGLIDVAGLMRRSLVTPVWARNVLVGTARFADFLGRGSYPYGSNLVARVDDRTLIWPRGVDVPASTSAVLLGSGTFDTWTGPEDKPFDHPALKGDVSTRVPFTLYDPELMAAWAEDVWARAQTEAVDSLGVRWTATTASGAHEITADARCAMPQTIPFEADNDDLFKDSDAP